MKNGIKAIILLLAVTILTNASVTSPLTRVKVEGGLVEGTVEDGIAVFKGIPFAAPPIGELRWKAPQPVIPWEEVLDCKAFGASPMQSNPAPFMFWSEEFLIPEEPIGEDCLYLNIWTGAESADEKLPVLVYIYGGGFMSGGSGCPIYDGRAMAEKGVIFVSFNYRVGVFGFLAHPELTHESENETSGNYALLDMIAALEWVKRNISEFGGDPDNVTIAGQSAGAFGVNYLTISPLAKGLFHRAIAQSGAGFLSSPFRRGVDLKGAEQLGVEFCKRFNAESIADLRSIPADTILKTGGGINWPITDGYVIRESIMVAYTNGNQNDVPVIIGWNKDDKVMPFARPVEQFREQVKERFGDLAEDFFSAYPADTEDQSTQSQFDMSRDETFGIQIYTWAKMQSKTGSSPVYVYNFNRQLPAHSPETQFGAFHSGEIVYAYNNLHTLDRPWEPVDYEIAGSMSDYWVNFARTGNPNGPGLPIWDHFSVADENVMVFDTTLSQQPLPDRDKLGFWEKYYASLKPPQ